VAESDLDAAQHKARHRIIAQVDPFDDRDDDFDQNPEYRPTSTNSDDWKVVDGYSQTPSNWSETVADSEFPTDLRRDI
jgi:hypothetical protein